MTSSVSHLSDFSDRFSPMLVKELRQGLRAKTFIAVFLGLQIFLAVMLLSASAAATNDRAGSVVSNIIFIFFSIAVLIVQPLRGVTALSSEIKSNTIEMMVLTRLSAWRIIAGKWVALVSQSALLLATIIPYLILRYFFGGMNLFAEMLLLALVFLTSMGLTAVTVGFSGNSSAVIRGLLPIAAAPVLLISIFAVSFGSGFGNLVQFASLSTVEARLGVLSYSIAVVYIGGMALSLGASLIAPAAENHSTVRRLVAFGLPWVFLPWVSQGNLQSGLLVTYLSIVAFPAIGIALTESAPLVPTVCRPFVRRGLPGKALGLFLWPGRASGILFSALLGIVCTLILHLHPDFDEVQEIFWLGMLGTLLLPAVSQTFFFRGHGQRVANYLLILAACLLLSSILSTLADATANRSHLWAFAWCPTILPMMLSSSRFDSEDILTAARIVAALYAAVLLISALRQLKSDQETIRQAGELPDPKTLPGS